MRSLLCWALTPAVSLREKARRTLAPVVYIVWPVTLQTAHPALPPTHTALRTLAPAVPCAQNVPFLFQGAAHHQSVQIPPIQGCLAPPFPEVLKFSSQCWFSSQFIFLPVGYNPRRQGSVCPALGMRHGAYGAGAEEILVRHPVAADPPCSLLTHLS